jgi:deazaflavin-dependent oxidoreductase (nitroreductase family)
VTDPGIGDQLAGWGRIAILETRGRRSGRPSRAAVGFVEGGGGAILVAAGEPTADWAQNLAADPAATATIGERTASFTATELEGPERHAAIAALILKYGTPSEGLGRGPVFRLDPVIAEARAPG